jgi:hypothetical protein
VASSACEDERELERSAIAGPGWYVRSADWTAKPSVPHCAEEPMGRRRGQAEFAGSVAHNDAASVSQQQDKPGSSPNLVGIPLIPRALQPFQHRRSADSDSSHPWQ